MSYKQHNLDVTRQFDLQMEKTCEVFWQILTNFYVFLQLAFIVYCWWHRWVFQFVRNGFSYIRYNIYHYCCFYRLHRDSQRYLWRTTEHPTKPHTSQKSMTSFIIYRVRLSKMFLMFKYQLNVNRFQKEWRQTIDYMFQ